MSRVYILRLFFLITRSYTEDSHLNIFEYNSNLANAYFLLTEDGNHDFLDTIGWRNIFSNANFDIVRLTQGRSYLYCAWVANMARVNQVCDRKHLCLCYRTVNYGRIQIMLWLSGRMVRISYRKVDDWVTNMTTSNMQKCPLTLIIIIITINSSPNIKR